MKIGATVGVGSASGIRTALGNTSAGHIISGVAGGVIRRAAERRIATRLKNRDIQVDEELQPLLTGERLG